MESPPQWRGRDMVQPGTSRPLGKPASAAPAPHCALGKPFFGRDLRGLGRLPFLSRRCLFGKQEVPTPRIFRKACCVQRGRRERNAGESLPGLFLCS